MAMSNGKKWLIGCGGCLGVIVLLVILGVVGTGMWVGSSTDKASEALLGAKAPTGYFAMGLTLPESGKTGAVLTLTSNATKQITIVFDYHLNEKEAQIFSHPSSPEFKEKLQSLLQAGMSTSSSASRGSITIENTANEKLGNGKSLPVVSVKLYDKNKEAYVPVVAALVMEANNRMVVLAGMDPNVRASSPDADFSTAYDSLSKQSVALIDDTKLDDLLVNN